MTQRDSVSEPKRRSSNREVINRLFDRDQGVMEIIVRIGPESIAALNVHVRNVELKFERWIFMELIRKPAKFVSTFLGCLSAVHPVPDDRDSSNP